MLTCVRTWPRSVMTRSRTPGHSVHRRASAVESGPAAFSRRTSCRLPGASWQPLTKGLPQDGAYETVLRDALAVDDLATPGVYFGTRSGKVFGSADEGESWSALADGLPPVISVKTAVV